MAPTAGILLTGGRSRRMGVDKASLVVDGETLAVRAGRLLATVCEPTLELGDGASGLDHVREAPAGAGPLAALAAAGVALRARGFTGPALVLAVDLPTVGEPLLRWLRDRPGTPPWCRASTDGSNRCAPATAPTPWWRRTAWSSPACGRCTSSSTSSTTRSWRSRPGARSRRRTSFLDVDTPTDAARFGVRPSGVSVKR